jgi:arsenate reductase (thioredoxin)
MTVFAQNDPRRSIAQRIRLEADALAREFAGTFSRETIDRVVDESARAFADARRTEFVPILVRRFSRERLVAAAQVAGLAEKTVPELLFVCVHNAGRSQAAAVLSAHLGGDRVHVRSAGSTPAAEINATVVRVMAERGLDLSQSFPKPLTDDVVRAADVVITMGCGDACPIYPGKRYVDWEVRDPSGEPIEVVRAICDDIEARVVGLLAELGVTASAAGA